MIVVDTSVLVHLLLPDDDSPLIDEVAWVDDVWHAPALWRSELRDVLVKKLRAGALTFEDAVDCLIDAEQLLGERTREADPERVIDLALQSGCTAYDCEFIDLALRLELPLVTLDSQLLTAFPDVAVAPDEFLQSHDRR
ncbi:MAG: PIN domain-containing protein [Planctomycetes bacterium]|nr:PIN domain-containing protein [Planctomycetota bacterium]